MSEIELNHRPSSLAGHIACPARAYMEHGVNGDDYSNPDSYEGDHMHALLSYVLTNNIHDINKLKGKGLKYLHHNGETRSVNLTDSRLETIQEAIDSIVHVVGNLDGIESEIQIQNVTLENQRPCTIDILKVQDDALEILFVGDYKNGAQPVDAVGNYQLLSYMYSVYKKLNDEIGYTPDAIVGFIIQPNNLKGETISTWEISTDELLEEIEFIRENINEIDSGENLAFKTSDHCMTCSHNIKCVERNKKAMEIFDMTLEELENWRKDNTITADKADLIHGKAKEVIKILNHATNNVKAKLLPDFEYGLINEALDSLSNELEKITYEDSEGLDCEKLANNEKEVTSLINRIEKYVKRNADVGNSKYIIVPTLGKRSFPPKTNEKYQGLVDKLKEDGLPESSTITSLTKKLGEEEFLRRYGRFVIQKEVLSLQEKPDDIEDDLLSI